MLSMLFMLQKTFDTTSEPWLEIWWRILVDFGAVIAWAFLIAAYMLIWDLIRNHKHDEASDYFNYSPTGQVKND